MLLSTWFCKPGCSVPTGLTRTGDRSATCRKAPQEKAATSAPWMTWRRVRVSSLDRVSRCFSWPPLGPRISLLVLSLMDLAQVGAGFNRGCLHLPLAVVGSGGPGMGVTRSPWCEIQNGVCMERFSFLAFPSLRCGRRTCSFSESLQHTLSAWTFPLGVTWAVKCRDSVWILAVTHSRTVTLS